MARISPITGIIRHHVTLASVKRHIEDNRCSSLGGTVAAERTHQSPQHRSVRVDLNKTIGTPAHPLCLWLKEIFSVRGRGRTARRTKCRGRGLEFARHSGLR